MTRRRESLRRRTMHMTRGCMEERERETESSAKSRHKTTHSIGMSKMRERERDLVTLIQRNKVKTKRRQGSQRKQPLTRGKRRRWSE